MRPRLTAKEAGTIALRMVVALIVLGGAYLALAVFVGRQLPSSATVEGVRVGGMSLEHASATLKRELAAKAATPVRVDIPGTGKTLALAPASAGLSLDIDGTLEGMAGFTLNPALIWEHLNAPVSRQVRTSVDDAALRRALTEQAKTVDAAPKEGSVTFPGGRIVVVPSSAGMSLVVDPIAAKIRQGWPRTPLIQGEVMVLAPKLSQGAIDAAVRDFAIPAMSAPISLVVGDRTAPLTPAQYAPTITITQDATGNLAPVVDRPRLTALVVEATRTFLVQPQNARILLVGGAPQITPSVDGVGVDSASVAEIVIPALTAPDRRAVLKATVAKPALTTEGAQALGVKDVIATFDSAFPYNPSRTANLTEAANTVNGTYIAPGAVFSLNRILGERTADKGYQEGYVIENGRLVKGTGGGVSQISTVVYNLAWFSAAQLVEHTSHSFYISRYPEGREATVYWPNIDNKWKNTSPYGMLLQMWVADGQVHGKVWSTKAYDVEAVQGPRSNVKEGAEIVDDTPECVPQPQATPGFDVTVQRVLKQNGAVVKTESYTTHYNPEDKVTCTNPNHKT